jgi:hypothetical protein
MNDKWRLSEDAQLSIDFIIGFTIFMIAFIFVATMMSGLLVNLQSQTIDYDAVAYRTGVMLTEDPGEPSDWHLSDLSIQREDVERLGLSIGRNSPEILQQAKIEKFFRNSSSPSCEANDEFCFPADYRQKLIFGDYPYNFHISLKEIDGDGPWSLGPEPPENHPYGYIRRSVLIKKPTYAIVNVSQENAMEDTIKIFMDMEQLYNLTDAKKLNPAYLRDPLHENMSINLQNFTISGTALTSMQMFEYPGPALMNIFPDSPTVRCYNDTGIEGKTDLTNNTTILFERGYFDLEEITDMDVVELRLTFSKEVCNESTIPLNEYAYNPPLVPAVLEVKVW